MPAAAGPRCRPEAVIDALSSDADLRAVVTKAPASASRAPSTSTSSPCAPCWVSRCRRGGRTHTARLVHAYGSAVNDSAGGLTHAFPTVTQLAAIDPAHLAVPGRRRSLAALIGALADGDLTLDAGCDWGVARARLLEVPGSDRGPRRSSRCAASGIGFPRQRPGCPAGRRAAGTAGRPTGAHRSQRSLAAVAVVRGPAPLDHPGPFRESLATEGGDAMTTMRYRTIDSPVGPLTLAGVGSTLMHLRMVDQTHEPDRSGWEPADGDAFGRPVEQLSAYFAGELTEFDLDLELAGTEFQRRVWAHCAPSHTGRPARTGRSPNRSVAGSLARGGVGERAESDRHHRALPSGDRATGGMTGYGGGIDRKRALLALEKSRKPDQLDAIRLNTKMPGPPIGGAQDLNCVRRCPTFPPGLGSIIGAGWLSFRVRDGPGVSCRYGRRNFFSLCG